MCHSVYHEEWYNFCKVEGQDECPMSANIIDWMINLCIIIKFQEKINAQFDCKPLQTKREVISFITLSPNYHIQPIYQIPILHHLFITLFTNIQYFINLNNCKQTFNISCKQTLLHVVNKGRCRGFVTTYPNCSIYLLYND